MTPPKKRPKVRYRPGEGMQEAGAKWLVCHINRHPSLYRICDCYTKGEARRIASALNWHEAHKRGEL